MNFSQGILAWITVLLVKNHFFVFFASSKFPYCFVFFFLFKYITNFTSILECGLLLYDVFSIIRYDYLINGKNE